MSSEQPPSAYKARSPPTRTLVSSAYEKHTFAACRQPLINGLSTLNGSMTLTQVTLCSQIDVNFVGT